MTDAERQEALNALTELRRLCAPDVEQKRQMPGLGLARADYRQYANKLIAKVSAIIEERP